MEPLTCLVGKWTDESKKTKEDLIKFLQERCKGIVLQRGSMCDYEINHPRLWEYATAIMGSKVTKGNRILDVGGANSLLGWYLAEREIEVVTTDLLDENVNGSLNNATKFKGSVTALKRNIIDQPFDSEFDIVFCINVIEHVMEWARKDVDSGFLPGFLHYWTKGYKPSKHEIETEEKFVKALAKAVKSNGLLVITYDYATIGRYQAQIKCASVRSLADMINRIVVPSNLNIIGEIDFGLYEDATIDPPASTGIVFLVRK